MKLHLKEPEINKAIEEYLKDQGIRTLNKDITISFTAGRKNSGLSAEVNIEDMLFDPSTLNSKYEPAPTPEEIIAFNEIPVVAVEEILPNVPVGNPEPPVKTTSLFS